MSYFIINNVNKLKKELIIKICNIPLGRFTNSGYFITV